MRIEMEIWSSEELEQKIEKLSGASEYIDSLLLFVMNDVGDISHLIPQGIKDLTIKYTDNIKLNFLHDNLKSLTVKGKILDKIEIPNSIKFLDLEIAEIKCNLKIPEKTEVNIKLGKLDKIKINNKTFKHSDIPYYNSQKDITIGDFIVRKYNFGIFEIKKIVYLDNDHNPLR